MKIMKMKQTIQLFEEKKVRTVWDDEQEKWYFSIEKPASEFRQEQE